VVLVHGGAGCASGAGLGRVLDGIRAGVCMVGCRLPGRIMQGAEQLHLAFPPVPSLHPLPNALAHPSHLYSSPPRRATTRAPS